MTVTINKAINRFLASLGMTFRVAGIEGKRVDDCIVNSFSPPLIILAVIPTAGRNLIAAMRFLAQLRICYIEELKIKRKEHYAFVGREA